MTVAAIIPTIADREHLLAEALASVHTQTRPVDQIAVEHDHDRNGPAVTRNRAVQGTDADWLAFLDDDDVWYPNHIEALLTRTDADVIYTDCELAGNHPGLLCNVDFNAAALEHGNYIPVTVLIRRTAFDAAGGFDPDDRYEDWQLWRRLTALGATFAHVRETTWCYRFGAATMQRTYA